MSTRPRHLGAWTPAITWSGLRRVWALLTWRHLVEAAAHVLIWAVVGFVLVLAVIGSVHPTADNGNHDPAPPSATPPPPPSLPGRSTP